MCTVGCTRYKSEVCCRRKQADDQSECYLSKVIALLETYVFKFTVLPSRCASLYWKLMSRIVYKPFCMHCSIPVLSQ